MIRRLGTVLHLAQTLMHTFRRLVYGLGKQLIGHKMGTGAGGQKAAVPYKLHAAHIDFPIALDGIFHGI